MEEFEVAALGWAFVAFCASLTVMIFVHMFARLRISEEIRQAAQQEREYLERQIRHLESALDRDRCYLEGVIARRAG